MRALILLVNPLTGVTMDLYAPTLPALQQVFNTTEATLVISVYLLATGLAQIPAGAVTDAWGRRRPLLVGLGLLSASSVLALAAPSFGVLLLARALQGVGTAFTSVISKAVLTDSYAGDERLRMANLLTIAFSLGPILAPALGGYLQQSLGWWAPFVFLSAYALVCWLGCALVWTETLAPERRKPLSGVPANLATVLGHGPFLRLVVSMSCVYALISVYNVFAPFLMEVTFRLSPSQYGSLGFVMGGAFFLGNLLNRALRKRWEADWLLRRYLTAAVLLAGATVLTSAEGLRGEGPCVVTTALILLCGGGAMANQMGLGLSTFPQLAGTASAVLGGLMMGGAGLASLLGGRLPAGSQLALGVMYLGLMVVAWLAIWPRPGKAPV